MILTNNLLRSLAGKKIYISTMLLSCMLFIPSLNKYSHAADVPPMKAVVKVFMAPFMAYAPIFIAIEEGYFAEQDIEIEPVRFSKHANAIPALLTGQLDVAPTLISAASLNAIGKSRGEFKVVADLGHFQAGSCSSTALLGRPETIQRQLTPEDIRNRVIDTPPPSVHYYFLDKWLANYGLTTNDIKNVYLQKPIIGESLERGTLDFTVLSEPWITRIVQAGQGRVIANTEDELPDFQFAAILYGPSFLEENVELGKKFMTAYLKGVQQYLLGKTERNIEIIAQHTGLEVGLLQEVCFPSIHEDGHIDFQSIDVFQRWAQEKGFVESLIEENTFWDQRFIKHAQQILKSI